MIPIFSDGAKNRLVIADGDPTVVARARASRGGVADYSSVPVDWGILGLEPIPCDLTQYRGLDYVDRDAKGQQRKCPFAPGREDGTTEEYARFEDGVLITYPVRTDVPYDEDPRPTTYPGLSTWPGSNWETRAIDNMYPTFDQQNIRGEGKPRYSTRETVLLSGSMRVMDAVGKDIMILEARHHISPMVDRYQTLRLHQLMAEMETGKPHVRWVLNGQNYSGLPVKARDEFGDRREYYTHANWAERSGASGIHRHGRVISYCILPGDIEESYQRVESAAQDGGYQWMFKPILDEGSLTISQGEHFALLADPAPKHSGGLRVISRNGHRNILDLLDPELREFGALMQQGELLLQLAYGGVPYNVYMRQIFKGDINRYPSYVLNARLDPRGPRNGTHALIEHGGGTICITEDPFDVAPFMRYLTAEAEKLGHPIGLEAVSV